jgi:hypothetical protein
MGDLVCGIVMDSVDDVSIDDDSVVLVPCDCWNPNVPELIPEVPHFPLDSIWMIGAAFVQTNMRWRTESELATKMKV